MTAAVKRDLQIVQMRNYLDPKHYYKASDSKTLPQQFQVGTVVEAAHEFKTSRLTKRQRKPTMADALLADQSFRKCVARACIALERPLCLTPPLVCRQVRTTHVRCSNKEGQGRQGQQLA